MNTKGLAKMYDLLTPFERLPLIMAATERGDDAEADRLSRSAPRIHVALPDYHGLGEGLLLLSLFHAIELLDLGMVFWQAQAVAAQWEEFAVSKKNKDQLGRVRDGIRMIAYRFCVEADGWRRLCAELKINPEYLLRDLPCYDSMRLTEKAARSLSWTPEEAAAFLRLELGDAELSTVEGAAKAMREFINQRVAWWG